MSADRAATFERVLALEPGRTALLVVDMQRGFVEAGESLDVGLSLNNRAVVPSAALLRGVVVRSEALGEHRQLVAVRYTHRDALQAAA